MSTDIPDDVLVHADYYARHWYSARCYAREYLRSIGNGDENLSEAVSAYEEVASRLRPVWESCSKKERPTDKETPLGLAQCIRDAKKAEETGIESIRKYLASS